MKSKTPIIKCKLMSDGVTLRCWCPYCKRYHYHYNDPKGSMYRVEHCSEGNSPYLDTGYLIKINNITGGKPNEA